MARAEEGQEIGTEAKEGGNAGQSGVVPYTADQEGQGSQDGDHSVAAMNGSNNFNLEEDPLEDGEIGELALLEDGEIVDIDPEPFKDQCLHWLGRMQGEIMEEDDLFEKTWHLYMYFITA
ncbi:hypothetical protein FRC11_004977 [Ceratobasidium sp. 423]|nr:hypothetical protein FRC11_004977 [Ceratobasidium sp. 423]